MKIKTLGWLGLIMALVITMSGFMPAAPAAQAAPATQIAQAHVWVEYVPGQTAHSRVLQNAGAEFFYSFDDLNSFVVGLPANLLAEIEAHPLVSRVYEDVRRYADAQTVKYSMNLVQGRDLMGRQPRQSGRSGSPTEQVERTTLSTRVCSPVTRTSRVSILLVVILQAGTLIPAVTARTSPGRLQR